MALMNCREPAPEAIVLVRRAEPAELTAVGELAVTAYRADGLISRADRPEDHYAPILRDAATRDVEAEVWVAVDGAAQVLGTVTWCPPGSSWREVAKSSDEGEFRMLAVAPVSRRRGVARALVEACLARARADGMHAVVLSSLPEMTAAHRLYRELGFVRTPELDHRPIPAVHLWTFRLDLAAPSVGTAPSSP
jgi:ribosomal protein S18 acetylase RimI-like enzyme